MSRKNASDFFVLYDGLLVEIEGQIVERNESATHFLLKKGKTLLPVTLENRRAADVSLGLPGSVIRLTGICAARKDRNGDPEVFEILAALRRILN
jgi:hypothetical protein